jgi:hypothetical protein
MATLPISPDYEAQLARNVNTSPVIDRKTPSGCAVLREMQHMQRCFFVTYAHEPCRKVNQGLYSS